MTRKIRVKNELRNPMCLGVKQNILQKYFNLKHLIFIFLKFRLNKIEISHQS